MRIPRTATLVIAGVTTLAWMLAAAIGASDTAAALWGFIPARFSGYVELSGAMPAILTPLSATLVHGGLMHLVFNLLMLVWCGMAVERVLGRGALLLLYGVGAYTAAIAQWAVDQASVIPMIG
jgi:membrane associated rhomboid family serine protease